MLDAGAIVHARTTAPEFSCACFTHSRLHGVTRNPWNPEFGVGGSSGGVGRRAGVGDDDARERLGHRRLDPRARLVQRRRRLQAAVRPRGPGGSRSTSTRTATAGRSPARSPTRRCTRTCWPGPTRRTSCRCGRRSCCRRPSTASRGCGSRSRSTSTARGRSTPRSARNTLDCADALRAAGAVVDEVSVDVPNDLVMRCAAIHFRLGFGAWIAQEAAAHPDEVTAYAAAFGARDDRGGGRRARCSRSSRSRRGCTRRSGRCSRRTTRCSARRSGCAASSPATTTSATASRSAAATSRATSTRR